MNEVRFHPAVDYTDALLRAAEMCGIDAEYWDICGTRHVVSDEVRRGILEALGWDVSSFDAVERERLTRFEENFAARVPKTCVVSAAERSVSLTLPAGEPASICYEIALESGEQVAGSIEACELLATRKVAIDPRTWVTYELPVPAEIPLGYHSLKIAVNGRDCANSTLIICPDRTYIPAALAGGGKAAGFNVALYGLRSDRNWGCGDFTDLRALCDWARDIGFSFIGVNPLHALHNRAPYNTSPYLPLSIFYKNLLYLDIEAVPEFAASDSAQRLFRSERVQCSIRQLRESEFVEYERVDRLKRTFLNILFRDFHRARARNSGRPRAFDDYCTREGELLEKFALYCALDEVLHKQDRNRWTWRDWPPVYQDPDSDACRQFAAEHPRTVAFYKYIQFVIEEQLAATQAHALEAGMQIGLYHDLAVATDHCGADLWAHRSFYVKGCRVGAPPDDFSPNGQDWCFPPPHAGAHRASGYHLFRESIRKIAQHGGALRMDHVMRLVRLFWIPEGAAAAQGTYVRDYALDLLRVLALESVRTKTIIVGEDLGTITDEIRQLLSRFCVLSYRLFYFEKNPRDGSFKSAAEYPREALVASSTHDLPTLAGFWTGRDIEARKAAGLIDDAAYWMQIDDRKREKQRMLDRLHAENLLPDSYPRDSAQVPEIDSALHNAIIAFLARVPSMLLLLNQEDLTMEPSQQNLPGSTAQYPNWQRKMRWKIEELRWPEVDGYARMFRDQLARTARRLQ